MKRFLAALLLLWGAAATAQGLSEDALAKLRTYEETVGRALLSAFAEGTPADHAALAEALSGAPQIALDESLLGDWQCRTIRMGKEVALRVFTRFDCRFFIEADQIHFEKLTGSERSLGRISYLEGRAIYSGLSYPSDASRPTPQDLSGPTPEGTSRHIALFERISDWRARLLFPTPTGGVALDILELTR